MCYGLELILNNAGWKIGRNSNIEIWNTKWVHANYPSQNTQATHPPGFSLPITKVKDLITPSGLWDERLIRILFSEECSKNIQAIPICASSESDYIYWPFTSSGHYSVKSGYGIALETLQDHVSTEKDISRIGEKEKDFCKKILWRLPVPYNWKIFLWKIITSTLPIGYEFQRRNIGRRSNTNYTLLSQVDDHPTPPKLSGGGGGDWDQDHRNPNNRVGNMFALQRQSSGSSFGESSLSGDYYVPSISLPAEDIVSGGGGVGAGEFMMRIDGGGGGSSASSKSWAQQTEESYQLQLALALRLSSEAACADDPNFLDPMPDDSSSRLSSSATAESISHRFWVNGCLSYFDKIPDGFYIIYGMDPYVWTMCADLQELGRIPSIDTLKSVDPVVESSLEVVLIDRRSDATLKELLNRAVDISSKCITSEDVVDQLAKLVWNRLKGAASTREEDLVPIWEEFSAGLRDCLGSVVLPIGNLSVGLCRHRALLFKVLADAIDLPCRIAKGCKYCSRNDATSCLVRFGLDREYLVDLVGQPGCLCEPDSLLNGPSSISISSPLRFPRFRSVEPSIDFRSLAKQYFSDSQSLNLVFDGPSSGDLFGSVATFNKLGAVLNEQDAGDAVYHDQICRKLPDGSNAVHSSMNDQETSQLAGHDRDSQFSESRVPAQNTGQASNVIRDPLPSRFAPPSGQLIPNQYSDSTRTSRFEASLASSRAVSDASLDMDDLIISWSDLVMRDRIGSGSFGTVHRAEWNGSVSILYSYLLSAA
ncbi:hypothetical protein KSS87_014751 [Heliosperma pusillum]|nr:hypothetical protein KSS87_014751 [Heliosperma pusillum]